MSLNSKVKDKTVEIVGTDGENAVKEIPMKVTQNDFEMARNLTKYSVKTSFALLSQEKHDNRAKNEMLLNPNQ